MIESIAANWDAYLATAVAIVLLFDRLAKLFPTLAQNGRVSRLYRVLAVLGARVPDNPGSSALIGDGEKKPYPVDRGMPRPD